MLTRRVGLLWPPAGGFLLDTLLRTRQHHLNGVANGIDMVEWDPSTDEHIPANYSLDDMSGKRICKAKLQEELGLQVNPDIPLVGFIGRLDSQKAPDIFLDAAWGLRQRDVQVRCRPPSSRAAQHSTLTSWCLPSPNQAHQHQCWAAEMCHCSNISPQMSPHRKSDVNYFRDVGNPLADCVNNADRRFEGFPGL